MNPEQIVGTSWAPIIGDEFSKPYMQKISKIVRFHRHHYNVFPSSERVFRAFYETPYEKVKVVIIGQDPYPTEGHADGLAFSSGERIYPTILDIPHSLKIIFEEVERDVGKGLLLYQNPDLGRWARQGVLLLNTALTVVEDRPGSHSNIGWDQLVRTTIAKLNAKENQIVYLLWGRQAQSFIPFIKRHHEYLTAYHPAARNHEFKGCRHFSKCNSILELSNQEPVNWITNEKN